MKILLVYPETPSTFWSFKNAVKFVSKRSSEPPLGLLTVASLLPIEWEKKLIDTNVSRLHDRDILWADYIFISGMDVHKESFTQIVGRCNRLDRKVVAGGPMCTTRYSEFKGVDHFVLNEAEITLPRFLADLKEEKPKHVYETEEFSDLSKTPIPEWHLLEMNKYASMDVQYSRGCPFRCDFCSVTTLYGHRPRCKSSDQFLRELDALFRNGWSGTVFIVDDNFIGNKKKLKEELLPTLYEWSSTRGHPFLFTTEVSMNLADDEELVDLMVQARFRHVFVGIETPDEKSLAECGKVQNRGRDLVGSIKFLQRKGLDVSAGFIVGFDQDKHDIFDRQIQFIQMSGIVTAMVGLLNAPIGTSLFKRLRSENRILENSTGNNMDGSLNFVPKLDSKFLVEGFWRVVRTIYSQKEYFERIKTFFGEHSFPKTLRLPVSGNDIKAVFRAIWRLGILEKGRSFFWRLIIHVLWNYPHRFAQAMRIAIYGYHFRKIIGSSAQ